MGPHARDGVHEPLRGAKGDPRAWAAGLAVLPLTGLVWAVTAGDDVESSLWRHYSTRTAAMNIAASAAIAAAGYVLSSRTAAPARAARVAIAATSIAVTLALLELPALFGYNYARAFGTEDKNTWRQLAQGINRRDEELISVHQPHSRFKGTVPGNLNWLGLPPRTYPVDVVYDRYGFRNDVDLASADIVAIGDSFVEAAELPRAATLVAVLERRLGVTVANLGQSGYGPQQELVVLKRYGVPLSPKLVLWFFFGGNDLGDLGAYDWQRRHLDELIAPPPLATRSFTRNALRAVARLTTPSRQEPSALARRHEMIYTRADGSTESIYFDMAERPWSEQQWATLTGVLTEARDVSRRLGADMLLVYIPSKHRAYQGFVQVRPEGYAAAWKPNDMPAALAAFCGAAGIEYLDSTVPLQQAIASGESVYFADDLHWNEAGHRVVAAAVADQIRKMVSLSGRLSGVVR